MNDMTCNFKTHLAVICLLGLSAGMMFNAQSYADEKDLKINMGAGSRTSVMSGKEMTNSSGLQSQQLDFSQESVRLYVNGKVHKNVGLTYNTEMDGEGHIKMLDGIAQFSFSETLNLWAGRFLPPSDRSNLSGPYYITTWDLPLMMMNYPSVFAGRDEGVAIWGQTMGSKFKYQAGVFEGREMEDANGDPTSNSKDNSLYAGRLTFNFWNAEPGYYNSSTYHGEKNIFAIGFAIQAQADGVGSVTKPGDFLGWNVDVLMEKKTSGGVVTMEGAYYNFDTDNIADAIIPQGNGFFLLGGLILPKKVGIGHLQPHFRYQQFDRDLKKETPKQIDLGLNYIIKGHDARVSFVISNIDPDVGKDYHQFKIGVQLQI